MRSESLVSRAFHQVYRAGFLLVGITDVDRSAESEPRSSCLGQADKTTLETTATTTNRVANGGREPHEREAGCGEGPFRKSFVWQQTMNLR
jgi:hypothetical protein